MSCCNNGYPAGNPCGPPVANSAACESLPSQITNFTTQFFGTVTKTEVDGVVSWVLPCQLDVGLENNPRASGEGLACYFLRLFHDGILGATGPQGEPGSNGTNGYNGFSITTGPFTPPPVGSSVSIPVAYNPAIAVGQEVFIATSGWYRVSVVDWTSGLIVAVFEQAILGAASPVLAGKIVQPTGPQGATGAPGATGATGATGPQGPAGETLTSTNQYAEASDVSPTAFALSATYQTVNTTVDAKVTLGSGNGVYQITAVVAIEMDTDAPAPYNVSPAPYASVYVQLYNVTSGEAVGKEQIIQLGPSQLGQVVVTAHYQPPANNAEIWIRAKASASDISRVVPERTTIQFIRIE